MVTKKKENRKEHYTETQSSIVVVCRLNVLLLSLLLSLLLCQGTERENEIREREREGERREGEIYVDGVNAVHRQEGAFASFCAESVSRLPSHTHKTNP